MLHLALSIWPVCRVISRDIEIDKKNCSQHKFAFTLLYIDTIHSGRLLLVTGKDFGCSFSEVFLLPELLVEEYYY